MSDFHAAMAAADVHALWEQGDDDAPPEKAHVWRWATMSPLLDAAVQTTSIGNAERRVLVMNNPHFQGTWRTGATVNLAVNFQVLMPGERARPHRHTMHALRFVVEGEGVTTVVEGKRCPMLPGDMILTPGWTWHEHVHEGHSRSVWVDALDVPLHVAFRNSVFEPGPVHDILEPPPDGAFSAGGLAPLASAQAPWQAYSPMFRYPWADAVQALAALPPAADGSRILRYTNPVTGGAVLSTIDCYLIGLEPGRTTRRYHSNAHAVCVVADGEGESQIGDEKVSWGRNDVFTLPQHSWVTHRASANGATLFQVTDRELLRRLDLLREEVEGR